MKTQLIILDRDGVINYDSDVYIKSPEEWHAIPKSLEAIAKLNRTGIPIAIATNQSGVARGYYDLAMLDRIHQKLIQELANVGGHIDHIFFCPHHPDDNCDCRKPKIGLLLQIQKKYAIDFENTFFIGDSAVDMQAALTAGCKPLLVLTGNGKKTVTHPEFANIPYFADLAETVNYLLHLHEMGVTHEK